MILPEDRRIFTPLARSSFQWKSIYKKRSLVERVNSRFDVSVGFEKHFIRRLTKMKLRCSLALCMMLAMALVRIKKNKEELMLNFDLHAIVGVSPFHIKQFFIGFAGHFFLHFDT